MALRLLLLLPFYVGSSEVAIRSPRVIKRDFRALGRLVKGSGAQVVFFFILPAAGNNVGRNRKTQLINTWLPDWCHWENFGFFDHGSVYMTPDLHIISRHKQVQEIPEAR